MQLPNRTLVTTRTALWIALAGTVLSLLLVSNLLPAHSAGWSTLVTTGQAPSERSRPAVAALGSRIYVFGGIFDDLPSGQFTPLEDLYRFDVRRRHWDQLVPSGPSPEARGFAGHAAVRARGEFAIFGGGQFDANLNVKIFGDLWLYSPRLNRWTEVVADNEGPPPRFDPKVWAAGHTLYVFGGLDEQFAVNNDLWAYSFRTNRWRLVTPSGASGSPPARANSMGPDEVHFGNLFFYGGEGGPDTGYEIFNDVWQFDLANETWQEITPAPEQQVQPPRNHASVAWIRGALYLYGGDVAGGTTGCGAIFPQNAVGELWRYDPKRSAWRLLDADSTPPPLKRHVSVVVGRSMYVLSGYDFAATGNEPEPCQVWNLAVRRYRPHRW